MPKASITNADDQMMVVPKSDTLPDAPTIDDLDRKHHIEHLNKDSEHADQIKRLVSVLVLATFVIGAGTIIGLAYFDQSQQAEHAYLAGESGQVSQYIGEVEISYDSGISWQVLDTYPEIKPGLHILTQSDASANLTFGQASNLQLAERSHIAFNSFNNIKVSALHLAGSADISVASNESWTFELVNDHEQSITAEGRVRSRYANAEWYLDVDSGWLKYEGSQSTDSLRIKPATHQN